MITDKQFLIYACADVTTMIQELGVEFSAEIKTKQDALDVTQAHLRAATRELAEQRRQIQIWQAKCGELDLVTQRMRNLEKAIAEEDTFDWTGRQGKPGPVDASVETPEGSRRETAGKSTTEDAAAQNPLTGETTVDAAADAAPTDEPTDSSFNLDSDPPVPLSNSVANLIRLRRLKAWHERMEKLMENRLKKLQGASAEKEFQCKKIVALCTGVPVDKIEDVGIPPTPTVASETNNHSV